MCGFAGYFGDTPDGGTGEPLLVRMVRAIGHRGPDENGHFVADGCGLGHARLSIVGLGDGRQPMTLTDGGPTVAFNGEIFNWVELRRDLEARGRRFRTSSDTEVLLHLWDVHGEDFLPLLNGDFAFVIFDPRRRALFMARDRMGVRPLYWTRVGRSLAFASEVKALLEVPGVEAVLDETALDQIFTLWAPIAPRTPFRDVFELEPAQSALVDASGMRLRTWWSLDYPDAEAPPAYRDEAAAGEELRALLEDATRLRMRADVPVGAYLSGGLDSSIVSAIAAPMAPAGLETFSIAFDSPEHDESAFQREMAAALGTRHTSITCTGADIANVFPEVIAATERPIIRTAPAPLHMLSGLVRERGLKVVLTGEGADEVFAGYDIFKEARVRRFCARRPDSALRPLLFRRLYPWLPAVQSQSTEYLSAFFGVRADGLDDPLHSHRPRFRGTAATRMFFSPELRTRLDGYDATEDLISRLPERFARWHPLHKAQYLESRFLLPGYILSSQGDRVAMAHGVEGRFPFLDHRLIEFASRLPPEMKLKGLVEKHLLREATRDLLPTAVSNRPKQPYRAPDGRSFLGGTEPAWLASALDERALADDGLFNPVAVGRLVDKFRVKPDGGFRDNAALVGILSTRLWLQRFAARPARRAEAA